MSAMAEMMCAATPGAMVVVTAGDCTPAIKGVIVAGVGDQTGWNLDGRLLTEMDEPEKEEGKQGREKGLAATCRPAQGQGPDGPR